MVRPKTILFKFLTFFALLMNVLSSHTLAQEDTSMAMTNTLTVEQVQEYVKRYFEGTRSMSAQQWASAFAPNAVVEDPTGAPLLTTPEAVLQQGEGFVGGFQSIGLEEQYVHVNGNEAVAYWIGSGVNNEGVPIEFEGVNVFQFNNEGQIILLKGYWSPDNIRPQ